MEAQKALEENGRPNKQQQDKKPEVKAVQDMANEVSQVSQSVKQGASLTPAPQQAKLSLQAMTGPRQTLEKAQLNVQKQIEKTQRPHAVVVQGQGKSAIVQTYEIAEGRGVSGTPESCIYQAFGSRLTTLPRRWMRSHRHPHPAGSPHPDDLYLLPALIVVCLMTCCCIP